LHKNAKELFLYSTKNYPKQRCLGLGGDNRASRIRFALILNRAKTFSFCSTFFSVCKTKTRPPLFGGRVGQSSNKDTVFQLTCVGAKTFLFA